MNAWQNIQEESKHVALLLLCNHSVYWIHSVYSIICGSAEVSIIFNSHFSSMNFFQSVFNPCSIQYMFWQTILRLLYMLFEEVTPFFVLNLSFGTFIWCLCILVLEKRAFIPLSLFIPSWLSREKTVQLCGLNQIKIKVVYWFINNS